MKLNALFAKMLSVTCALSVATPALAVPAIELVGRGALPGTTRDGLLPDPAVLEDGTPHDQVGALGSAISYTGVGTYYLACPDRGPADGTTSFVNRFYVLNIQVTPGAGVPVSVSLVSGALLTNERGRFFTGSSAAFDAVDPSQSLRLDSEGIRTGPRGTFFIADEYGPSLYEFDPAGTRLRSIPLPDKFLIAHPSADSSAELIDNSSGRQSNRGLEGLAISPDGRYLFGLMQSALLQDSALDPLTGKRAGLHNRLLQVDLATGATREYVYPLSAKENGANELLAIDDHRFLVIERDSNAGLAAAFKRIFLVDVAGATDVSDVASLPMSALPSTILPVAKSLFIDLLDPAFGLAGPDFPEKIEGLSFGPSLADGRILLLVTSDNDFVATQPSQFFAFAISDSALSGLMPQMLSPAIEVQPDDASDTIDLP